MGIKDFRAKRLRASQIIGSGSNNNAFGGLGYGPHTVIYSASQAANFEGGVSDSLMTSSAGKDADVFVSGAIGSRNAWIAMTAPRPGGTSIFGGDLHVSGNLTVGGSGGGSGADVDWVDGGNKLKTTSSVSIDADGKYVDGLAVATVPTRPNMADVFFFVSGARDSRGSTTRGTSVFGGDVVISGTLYAEKQIIEVDEQVSGALFISGNLFVSRSADVKQGLIVNVQKGSFSYNDFTVFGSGSGPGKKELITTKTNTNQVLILSGGEQTSLHVNEANYEDVSLFVSGATGSWPRRGAVRGTSLFGGDTVVSGGLKVFGKRDAEQNPEGGTISGSIHFTQAGIAYLKQGSNISITSASNGQITIDTRVTPGTMSNFTLAGDTGTQTILNADTLTVGGGLGITTAVSATDTATVNVDYAGSDNAILTAGAGTPVAADIIWFNDNDDDNIKKAAISTLPFTNNAGTVTSITAGTGLSGGTITASGTIAVDYAGVDSFIMAATNGTGITVDASNDKLVLYDNDASTIKYINVSQITSLASGQWTDAGDILRPSDGTGEQAGFGGTGNNPALYHTLIGSASIKTIGFVTASMGLSGSHTRLVDGTSAFIAGSNVTIVSASNGAVTISSTATVDGSGAANRIAYWADADTLTSDADLNFNGSIMGLTGSATGASSLFNIDRNYAGTSGNSTIISNDGASGILVDYDVTGIVASGQFQKHKGLWIKYDQSAPTHVGTVQGTGLEIEMTGSNSGIQSVDGISVKVQGSSGVDASRGIIVNAPPGLVADSTNGSHFRALSQADTGDYFDISVGADGASKLANIGGGDLTISGSGDVLVESADNRVLILSGGNSLDYNGGAAADVSFYVSGALGSRYRSRESGGSSIKGVSVFAGDVVISGSLIVSGGQGLNGYGMTRGGSISGSIHRTAEGLSYLVAGSGITVASASNGQVTISGTATSAEWTDEGDILRPNEAVGDSVGIGATGNATTAYPIFLNKDGGAIFNQLKGATGDFIVSSDNNTDMFKVDVSSDRIGIGTIAAPATTVHIQESAPTLRIQRSNNANSSTIEFVGTGGSTGAVMHLSASNDLVFKTHDGSLPEEILRLGSHWGTSNRQIILLSGSAMAASAMQPKEAEDINFFVSGAIASRDTTTKGTSVFGGDTVVSGSLTVFNSKDTMNGGTISGSIHFTSGGIAYLKQGPNISITSSSNGQITIDTRVTPGSMSSFTVAGDSGSSQTIENSNTLTIAGGTGLNSVGSATDTITVNVDYTGTDNFIEVHSATATPATGDKILFHDITDNDVKKTTIGDLPFGTGTMSSFTLAGDTGSSQPITDGNTLTVAGGVGIDSVASATDTVTLTLDVSELPALGSTADTADYVVIEDVTDNSSKKVLISNLPISSQWTDEGDILRPNEAASDSVGIGATGNTSTAYPIYLDKGGSAIFNQLNAAVDFRVASDNKANAIFVDGSTDQVLILSGGDSLSSDEAAATDVAFYVSGALGSRNELGRLRGTALFGGDVVMSGALYVHGSETDAQGLSAAITLNSNGGSQIIWDSPGNTDPASADAVIYESGGTLYLSGTLNARVEAATGEARVKAAADAILQGGDDAWVSGSDDVFIVAENDDILMYVGDKLQIIQSYGSTGPGTFVSVFAQPSAGVYDNVLDIGDGNGGVPGVVINDDSNASYDFRCETDNLQGALVVDAGVNNVMIGSNEISSTAQVGNGTDTTLFVSGTRDSRGSGTGGVATFAGDLYVSGAIYEQDEALLSLYTTDDADQGSAALANTEYAVFDEDYYSSLNWHTDIIPEQNCSLTTSTGVLSVTSLNHASRFMMLTFMVRINAPSVSQEAIVKVRDNGVGGTILWQCPVFVINNSPEFVTATIILPASAKPTVTVQGGALQVLEAQSGCTLTYRNI